MSDVDATLKPLPRWAAWVGISTLLLAFFWSAWEPRGRFIWSLEALPFAFGYPVMVLIQRRVGMSFVSHFVVWWAGIMMMVGAHYTFGDVPLGNWLQEALELKRNPYDRFGHIWQGVVPGLLVREWLLRFTPLQRGKLVFTLVWCVALSVAAIYEIIECWVAISQGESARAFLGSQGDVWDAQWDMVCAWFAAMATQLLLGPLQDRQMGLEKRA